MKFIVAKKKKLNTYNNQCADRIQESKHKNNIALFGCHMKINFGMINVTFPSTR